MISSDRADRLRGRSGAGERGGRVGVADVRFTAATRVLPGMSRPAVDGVDLHVRDGELLVLGGASGSGKSTLLRMLIGLEPFDSGRLAIGGAEATHAQADRRAVSLVFEGFALLPNLTLFENIALPLRLRRASAQAVHAGVARAAETCALDSPLSAHPDGLPFETRLRAILARAIVRGPEVVCLDEPLVGAGSVSAEDCAAIIRGLQRALGVTMIYATCRSADALALADRVAVLDHGRIQQVDRTRTLFERPATVSVAEFAGPARISLVRARVMDGFAWLGDFPLALTREQASKLTGGDVMVGLNPAHLRVGRRGPGIRATAVRVKDAGRFHVVWAATALDADFGPVELELPRVAGPPPQVGDRIVIGLSPRACHLFDPITGRRLPD